MYSMPQKSKCVPCKAGCQPWVCGSLGKFRQFRLERGAGALLEAGEQSVGYTGLQQECSAGPCQEGHRGQVSSPAVAGQRSGAVLHPPAVEGMRRVEGFLPGGAVQVSSPAAEKASVTSALQGTSSDRQQ